MQGRYVATQGLISLFFDSTMCIYGITDPMHRNCQAHLASQQEGGGKEEEEEGGLVSKLQSL